MATTDPIEVHLDLGFHGRYGRPCRAGRAGAVLDASDDARPPSARDHHRGPLAGVRAHRRAARQGRSSSRSSTASCGASRPSCATARASPTATCSARRSRRSRPASGDEAELVPGRPLGVRQGLLQARGRDGVRRQARRRPLRRGPEDAEIVLIGVSRTGKTPLSMYLGYLGYKTANVPLVRGIQPPANLFRIDSVEGRRPDHRPRPPGEDPRSPAARHRRRRGQGRLRRAEPHLRGARGGGAVQRRLGCPVVDVTNIALEEAANRVIDLVDRS